MPRVARDVGKGCRRDVGKGCREGMWGSASSSRKTISIEGHHPSVWITQWRAVGEGYSTFLRAQTSGGLPIRRHRAWSLILPAHKGCAVMLSAFRFSVAAKERGSPASHLAQVAAGSCEQFKALQGDGRIATITEESRPSCERSLCSEPLS